MLRVLMCILYYERGTNVNEQQRCCTKRDFAHTDALHRVHVYRSNENKTFEFSTPSITRNLRNFLLIVHAVDTLLFEGRRSSVRVRTQYNPCTIYIHAMHEMS